MKSWINNEAVDIWEPIRRRPAVPGRNYTPLVAKHDHPKGESSGWDLFAVQGTERRSFLRFPSSLNNEADSYTWEEAETLCSKLVEALQVWPNVNEMTCLATANNKIAANAVAGKAAVRALISAAHRVVFPSRPPLISNSGKPTLRLGVPFFKLYGLVHFEPDALVSTACEKVVSASTVGLGPVIEVPRLDEVRLRPGGSFFLSFSYPFSCPFSYPLSFIFFMAC